MKVVATDSALTALPIAIAVTLMCTSLSQHCHYHCCPSAVTVTIVTLLLSPSLSQHCARFCCRSAVLVFTVTTLCTSVSNRCGILPVQRGLETIHILIESAGRLCHELHTCTCNRSWGNPNHPEIGRW